MSVESLIIGGAIIVGATTQAGVGIGFSIIAGPLLFISLGAQQAVPLLLLLNTIVSLIATDLNQVSRHYKLILLSIIACAFGLVFGKFTYPLLSEPTILSIAACLILFGALSTFLRFRINQIVYFFVLIIAGLATVWTATPGPILIFAVLALGFSSADTRRLVQPIALIAYGAGLLMHGTDSWSFTDTTGIFVISAIIGSLIGRIIGPGLSHSFIINTVRMISIVAAIALLRRAFLLI